MQKIIISLVLAFLLCAIGAYGQTCNGSVGDNIFTDGSFAFGDDNVLQVDPRLAPGYSYARFPPPNDGSYCITNNTTSWGSFAAIDWIDIKDNSNDPRGYMMVVNASFSPGLFYEKTVTVCGSTNYEFSADVISMNDPSRGTGFIAPNVSFLINGEVKFSTGNVPIDTRWHTYGFTFTTDPDATEIKLSLRNNAPGGFGNDLALDNITFRPCGPTVVLIDTSGFCTTRQDITIGSQVIGSAFQNPVFQWQQSSTGNGGWLDIPGENGNSLTVSTPADGQYFRLTVSSSAANIMQSNCRIVSNPTRVTYQPERSDTILRTICKGDTIRLGDMPVFQAGIVAITSKAVNDCDSVTTFSIIVEDLSDFQIDGEGILCKGETNTLDAGDFAKYTWSNGASTPDLDIHMPGIYGVTVTSVNGCVGQDTIQVNNSEISDFDLILKPPICSYSRDGSIEITGLQGDSPPYEFSINGQAFQSDLQFLDIPGGDYEIVVKNTNGCTLTKTVTLKAPPIFAVRLDSSLTINLGDSLILSAISKAVIASYNWNPPDALSCVDCAEPLAKPLRTTTFTLIATNTVGCEASDSLTIFVNNPMRVYAPNVFSPNGDGVNDYFQLFPSREVDVILDLQIFDRWGNLLFAGNNDITDNKILRWDGSFNAKPMQIGVYVWTARVRFIDDTISNLSGDVTLIR
ncbi:MAG: gliding motility-associated C-terminal domain-containing protein [Saprospiraceae bacterium]|nr:gliding motility-associated C-terminal domain-containing protein [Saprospiraceae bacterium]